MGNLAGLRAFFSIFAFTMDKPIVTPLAWLRRLRMVLMISINEWILRRDASKGAALAFYALFSLAPILLLVIAIAGMMFGREAAQGEVYAQFKDLIGPSGAEAIQMLLASVPEVGAGLFAPIAASVLLLMGATTVFTELKDSLDEIWKVPQEKNRSGFFGILHARVLSFGMVLVLAFLLLVSLVISAVLAILSRYWGGYWGGASWLLAPAASGFSFLVVTVLFAVIYKTLPQVKLAWRDVSVGAMGTAALFSLGKYLIGFYLGNSGVASGYGAAGSIVALLLWVYYSAQIFFLGAEFTRQYALWFGSLRDLDAEAGLPSDEPEPAGPHPP